MQAGVSAFSVASAWTSVRDQNSAIFPSSICVRALASFVGNSTVKSGYWPRIQSLMKDLSPCVIRCI